MSNKSTFFNDPKKQIAFGILLMLIGITVSMIWVDYLVFAQGMAFGMGVAYFGIGMHKLYNKD